MFKIKNFEGFEASNGFQEVFKVRVLFFNFGGLFVPEDDFVICEVQLLQVNLVLMVYVQSKCFDLVGIHI